MTYVPASLRDLGAYWVAQGGVNLGVVGNQKHCAGYHLGRDRIYGTCACRPIGPCVPGLGSRDYSVQLSRDKAGLTDAASAIDLGRLGGTLENLYAFSRWLVAQCMAGAPGSRDVREIIYWNPSRDRVERWSMVDNAIHWGPGNGDLSHKTHTHISFPRDSQARDKRPLFRGYFDLPDTVTEDPMILFEYGDDARAGWLDIKTDNPDYAYLSLRTGKLAPAVGVIVHKRAFGPVVVDRGTLLGDTLARRTGYVVGRDAAFVLATDVKFVADPGDVKVPVVLTVRGQNVFEEAV